MNQPPHSIIFSRHGPAVFLAGAAILFIEIAGSKLLAPLYGSTLYVWSALITVTLLAIAAGAWWGGWLADKKPEPHTLSMLWIAASLATGAVVPLRRLVFPLVDYLDLGAGVLLSALLFFFLPLALLAAVSPVAVKLTAPGQETLGRTVGKISAVGTAGSCLGALVTGFFLVPHFPLSHLFLYLSLFLALAGVKTFWKGNRKIFLVILLLFWGGCLGLFSPQKSFSTLGESHVPVIASDVRQSLYGQVLMLEITGARLLFIDGVMQGGIQIPSGDSLAKYTGAMEILGLSAVPKARKALVIGLGAGTMPTSLKKRGLEVDVVEINPQIVSICERWFNPALDPGRLHVADGRRFLRKNPETFDLVFLDAFSGDEAPSHLMTQESFQEIRSHLSGGGSLVMNYMGFFEPPSSRVLATLAATLRTVYPSVDIFTTGARGTLSNFIIVARVQEGPWDPAPEAPWNGTGFDKVENYLNNRVKPDEPYPLMLTDDYCPLEWLDRSTRFQTRLENSKIIPQSSFGL